VLQGAQLPRILHVPPNADNEAQDVIDLADSIGLHLDPWQQNVLLGALGVNADGSWSAFEVGLIVSRQNGKGSILEAMVLAWLFLFDEPQVLFSAHEMKTAQQMFKRIRDRIRESADLRHRVANFYQSNERTAIVLRDGSECRFLARSDGSGRGFSASKIVFDEAFNLPDSVAEAQLPTTGAQENPQVWYTSSAGDVNIGPCDVLARVRRRGMAGADPTLAFFEWSAPFDEETRRVHGDPGNPRLWAQANPSMGLGRPWSKRESRIAALHGSLSAEGFAREELSVGNYPMDRAGGALDYAKWVKLADAGAARGNAPVFAVDVAQDRAAWISVLWRRGDGSVQVMLANGGNPMPAHRLVEECARLAGEWGADVVAPPAFVDDFDRAGVNVIRTTASEFAVGCGLVADAVTAGKIRHGNQEALNTAVRVAVWRSAGSQAERAFKLSDMPEVGPLAAVARGLWGLENYVPMPAIY
jgi:hypothetical protein